MYDRFLKAYWNVIFSTKKRPGSECFSQGAVKKGGLAPCCRSGAHIPLKLPLSSPLEAFATPSRRQGLLPEYFLEK